ncbi:Phosphate transporter PHO1 homolog 10 [Linum grandiflorum]
MKFGKELKKQMVPEWTEAYVDYYALRSILRQLPNYHKPHHQHQIPDVEGGGDSGEAIEKKLFRKFEEELEKVDGFYKSKVEEMVEEASELNLQLEAFLALCRKQSDCSVDDGGGEESGCCSDDDVTRPRSVVPDAAGGHHHMDSSFPLRKNSFNEPEDSSSTTSSTASEVHHTATITTTSDPDDEVHKQQQEEEDHFEILERVKIEKSSDQISPLTAIKGVFKDSREVELSQVKCQLRAAFIEFYHKLRLLSHYSYMNLAAFARILNKFEKVASRRMASSYMKAVEKSSLGSSNEVTDLLDSVEATFIKHFSDSNYKKGRRLLRPKSKKEKHSVTFLSGFFSGCSVALLVAVVLRLQTQKLLTKDEGASYMVNIFPLYSLFGYVVLHMLVYAADVYFWRRYRVNYPFIFGCKRGTELDHRQVFFLSSGLAFLVLASLLCNLYLDLSSNATKYKQLTELMPLGLIIVVVAILLCPFHVLYRSSRFFFVRCLFRTLCAPLFKERLSDFYLADNLTSQFQAVRCLELYICYYGLGESSRRQDKCHSHGIYNALYFTVAIVPFWIRLAQCLRRFLSERESTHAVNALKYLSTIIAVVLRTTFELKRGTTRMALALASSAAAAAFNAYWDVAVDWGLLRRNSKNRFLRDRILVPHKSVYFVAMAVDVVLRLAWMQLVLELNLRSLHKMAALSCMSCLEIVRRGLWNFFRLENEHLNNVGKYRAFNSVPLPFSYCDPEEEDDDKDD